MVVIPLCAMAGASMGVGDDGGVGLRVVIERELVGQRAARGAQREQTRRRRSSSRASSRARACRRSARHVVDRQAAGRVEVHALRGSRARRGSSERPVVQRGLAVGVWSSAEKGSPSKYAMQGWMPPTAVLRLIGQRVEARIGAEQAREVEQVAAVRSVIVNVSGRGKARGVGRLGDRDLRRGTSAAARSCRRRARLSGRGNRRGPTPSVVVQRRRASAAPSCRGPGESCRPGSPRCRSSPGRSPTLARRASTAERRCCPAWPTCDE